MAAATQRIRVGTAGVLLRYQSTLAVAEAFRALDALYPGRIDAGIARGFAAPPFDAALADGRPAQYSVADHQQKLWELQGILGERLPTSHPLAQVRLQPAPSMAGPPPFWVHSSSSDGAHIAAQLGAHYGFLELRDPHAGPAAIEHYRERFRPSPELQSPAWAVCVAGYCADGDRDLGRARLRFATELPANRGYIAGTAAQWRDELGALIERYPTREVIIQTPAGGFNVAELAGSYARIAAVARSLVSSPPKALAAPV